MTWSREFDESILPSEGRTLTTLRDAGEHIAALPKKEHDAPEWQPAMQALIPGPAQAQEGSMIVFKRERPQGGSSPRCGHPGQLEIYQYSNLAGVLTVEHPVPNKESV